MKQNSLIEARILRRRQISPTIVELVFASEHGLPAAEPGSHIDVHLPNGLVRQYSIVDPVQENETYRVGVRIMGNGRGGSQCLSEALLEGEKVTLGAPRNLFKLQPAERPIVLVAGGIGITPIHAMAQWLRQSEHQNWTLHYAYSTQNDTYFPSDWLLTDHRVHRYEAQAAGAGRMLDVDALVDGVLAQGGGDIYCCGPTGLMDALAARSASHECIRYVQETFVAPESPPSGDASGFTVVLARSGRTIQVAENQTILDALQASGIEVPHSCSQGICGACETAVLDGTPVHYDAILSPSEQEAGDTMMICCSRSATSSLTLDL